MSDIETSYPFYNSADMKTPDYFESLLLQNSDILSDDEDTATSTTSVTRKIASDDHLLPADFVPSSYSVLFGRGRRCRDWVGNRRLKVIASLFLERYTNAKSRDDKSEIVSEIQFMIQSAFGPTCSAFVKPTENGRWTEVSDQTVRDKIGQTLRDCLHTKYRSSVKNKVAKRRNRRLEEYAAAFLNTD